MVNEGAVRDAELDYLKERINEYKIMQFEDVKYKEIVDSLIKKGVKIKQEKNLWSFKYSPNIISLFDSRALTLVVLASFFVFRIE